MQRGILDTCLIKMKHEQYKNNKRNENLNSLSGAN